MVRLRRHLAARRRILHQRETGGGIHPRLHLAARGARDRGLEAVHRRRRDILLLRRHGQDHPVLVGDERVRGLRHLVERDGGQIGGGDAVFELDAGNRFPAEEVADVLAGVAGALARRAFVVGALVGGDQRAPRAIELRGAEAELLHAPGLEHDGLEAGGQSVLRHRGANLEQLERAAEAVGAGLGGHERRVGPARNLAEARVDHLAHELPHQGGAIVADRPLLLLPALEAERHRPALRFRIGGHAEQRLRVRRHGAVHGLHRRGRTRDAVEARAHQLLGLGGVEVADHHHGHLIRPVPLLVERHAAARAARP